MYYYIFLVLISSSFSSCLYIYIRVSSISLPGYTSAHRPHRPRLRPFSYHYYISPGGPSIIATIVPEATILNDLFRKSRERIEGTEGLSRDYRTYSVVFFFLVQCILTARSDAVFNSFLVMRTREEIEETYGTKKFSSLIRVLWHRVHIKAEMIDAHVS